MWASFWRVQLLVHAFPNHISEDDKSQIILPIPVAKVLTWSEDEKETMSPKKSSGLGASGASGTSP